MNTYARAHVRKCVGGKREKEKNPADFNRLHIARPPSSTLPAVVGGGGCGSYSPPVARTPRVYAPYLTPHRHKHLYPPSSIRLYGLPLIVHVYGLSFTVAYNIQSDLLSH